MSLPRHLVSICVPHASRSDWETVTKRGKAAQGFRLGRLVLKDVPVLGELAVFETHNVGKRSTAWGGRGPKSGHGR
jgi:hypothetical protein